MALSHILSRLSTPAVVVVALFFAACGGGEAEPEMADAETPAEALAVAEKINLNTASEADFLAIPGLGERMAHEFEEYRPYVSIQQFRREMAKYVDDAEIEAYEEYVFVPVDPNESDAATLQQLPGVDVAAAAALIEGRPYDSANAFLEALAEHVTTEEQAMAPAYLVAM